MKLIFSLIFWTLIVHSIDAQTADIAIEATPTTNTSGNNGKLVITIDPTSTTAPYRISITGPSQYAYSVTTSNTTITLTGLRYGDYSGTISGNNCCTARFVARVIKCSMSPVTGGGQAYMCDEVAEPGGDVKKFFATGSTSNTALPPALNYTFQVFHSMPSYLYDQLSPGIQQTMISIINDLIQTNYSKYEVLQQDEFDSEAPYVFAFNADGSLIWVYRNLPARDRGKGE